MFMAIFIIGLVLFFGVHSLLIIRPTMRTEVITRGGGEGAWMWPYLSVALTGTALIMIGYSFTHEASAILYTPAPGLRHLALTLMIPVFPFLLATYLPGRIRTAVKHPTLIATILWAIAHLLVNGSVVDVLLFGSFLVWAIADLISLMRRPNKAVRAFAPRRYNDFGAVLGGLALYGLFLAGLHAWLFDVSPLQ